MTAFCFLRGFRDADIPGMEMKMTLIMAAVLSLAAAMAAVCNYRKTKNTFDTIEKMLDDAMDGGFAEASFDEGRLSSLEAKFARFLASSGVSAQNVSAERDKIKTLISDISHQTKTPISNLLLYSELLLECELPDEARTDAAAIYRQAERLRFLIDSLIKLSRLESGIFTLSPQREPLQPMIQSVCGQFAAKAEEKGLALSWEDTSLSAVFDPKWTAEALGNLLDNAVKYTWKGKIALSVKSYEMFVRIDVTDTGRGIAEDELPKIFSRFYRSESVRGEEGVGIGLYLAREIISSEGGYIRASSVPGQGSSFSVFLPR